MLDTFLDHLRSKRAKRLMSTSRYRDQLADLPASLYPYWAQTACREFNRIPRDVLFFSFAAEALMEFFDCVASSGAPCALPSKAADSVWHAWLSHAPATLQHFCRKHYQRPIPHLQAAAMPGPMDEALAHCLVTARRVANVAPGGIYLPRLFSTDRLLRMPYGFGYRRVGNKIGVADLDARGRYRGHESFPTSLRPAGLLASRLIEPWEMPDPWSESIGAGGASADDGNAGSDGGSCGSSCGGGCGGGGGGD